jgi:predicted Zn-ribbon and HTH transcriptional regulator
MAYYTCGKCRFTFERIGEVENCPDCASTNVREATGVEVGEFC